MRRRAEKKPVVVPLVGLFVGLAVIAACGADDGFIDGFGPSPGFAGSASSSASGGTSSSSGRPDPTGEGFCSDRPFCGSRGCCPPGWRCLRDKCVAPGIACASDADCAGDRYCALGLVEPRCFPRETFCDDDAGANDDCIRLQCQPGPDLHLARSQASCAEATIYVYNFGRETVPAGAIIAIDQELRAVDAGAHDAGDAGGEDDAGDAGPAKLETVTGVTTDGILPGEVILMRIPVDTNYRALMTARVEHDAGTATDDCDPDNDTDIVFNGCGVRK